VSSGMTLNVGSLTKSFSVMAWPDLPVELLSPLHPMAKITMTTIDKNAVVFKILRITNPFLPGIPLLLLPPESREAPVWSPIHTLYTSEAQLVTSRCKKSFFKALTRFLSVSYSKVG